MSFIKPEISHALDSLLEEIHAIAESKVLRTAIRKSNINVFQSGPKHAVKSRVSCPLCKQAGRPAQHFLSKCKYLPQTDKLYFSKIRQATDLHVDDIDSDDLTDVITSEVSAIDVDALPTHSLRVVSTSRRVSTKQSPQMKVFYKLYPLQLILDTGAEISMIKTSVAAHIGATIRKKYSKSIGG